MENRPLVSIIMPAYNSGKIIKESIQSVINQTYSNWELLIINDGSTDDTLSKISDFSTDGRLHVISQLNSGVSASRNKGIEQAKGEYLAFLDSDDIWSANKLMLQIEYMLLNPDIGLVYTGNFIFNSVISDGSINSYKEPFKIEDDYHRLIISDFIVTSTVVVRIMEINKLYFDTDLTGTEDWDLWIRISKFTKIGYIKEPLVYYREHSEGISKNYIKQYHNDYLVRQKHAFNNPEIPMDIRRMSMWMLKKKSIFLAISQHGHLIALRHYLVMIYKFPRFRETYLFPFRFILKKR